MYDNCSYFQKPAMKGYDQPIQSSLYLHNPLFSINPLRSLNNNLVNISSPHIP